MSSDRHSRYTEVSGQLGYTLASVYIQASSGADGSQDTSGMHLPLVSSGTFSLMPVWVLLSQASLVILSQASLDAPVSCPCGYSCLMPIWILVSRANLGTLVSCQFGYSCLMPVWVLLSHASLGTLVSCQFGHSLFSSQFGCIQVCCHSGTSISDRLHIDLSSNTQRSQFVYTLV